ncbi:MAG: hypothetical protein SGARI_003321 [Bacillariaceae sp.]
MCSSRSCRISVHWGTCDVVGGLAYTCGAMRGADGNPWKGAKYSTDNQGNGVVQSFSVIPNYGMRFEGGLEDKVVIDDPMVQFLYSLDPASTVDGKSVIALEAKPADEPAGEDILRCYVGYSRAPSRINASAFLAELTNHECSPFNHTGNGNKAKVKTAVMDGWGRTTNATSFLFSNNYKFNSTTDDDESGQGGKAWFGGCTTTKPEEMNEAVTTAQARASGNAEDSIVAMISNLDGLVCGVQQEYIQSATLAPPAPTSALDETDEDADNSENEYLELNEMSSGGLSTVSSTCSGTCLLVILSTLLNYFV